MRASWHGAHPVCLSVSLQADPTLILPVACIASTYLNIEMGFSRLHESQTILRFLRDNLQLMLILCAPATATLPCGVLVYWATSTLFGHAQFFALRSPAVRAALGFPSPPPKPPVAAASTAAGAVTGVAASGVAVPVGGGAASGSVIVDPALTLPALAILKQHGIEVPEKYSGAQKVVGAGKDRRKQ